jgi:hypothetical protein
MGVKALRATWLFTPTLTLPRKRGRGLFLWFSYFGYNCPNTYSAELTSNCPGFSK